MLTNNKQNDSFKYGSDELKILLAILATVNY